MALGIDTTTFAALAASLAFGASSAHAAPVSDFGYGFEYDARIDSDDYFDELGGETALSEEFSGEILDRFDDPAGTGRVQLRADLSTGEIGIGNSATNPASGQQVDGRIFVYDVLTFDLTAFESTEEITYNFSTRIDGSLGYYFDEEDNFLEDSFAEFGMRLSRSTGRFTNSPLRFEVRYNIEDPTDSLTGSGELDIGDSLVEVEERVFPSGTFSEYGPKDFAGTFTLSGGETYVYEFLAFLDVDGSGDFFGTASFDLNGPVPFSSQSGQFLSSAGVTTPVPLPASLPLLGAGFGALLALGRRRRNLG